ncbi:aromatic-ring-hydroxylating dioxygenase subunit beta [Amycolatopsis jejuensis]|uniref:aromatic-ring-hydroxylating dioxygenase subunit beta n=1 Tax=Amycolatopsis jejuensis TaxID=330084 RepID=UPI0005268325|nr:aromatic-ring-hydroxylating dioxygenase subunit beta [Amycolatopsis jejuensis]
MTAEAAVLRTGGRFADAVELIWREAKLLDDKAYDEWDTLWTPDAHYVLPIDPDAADFAGSLNLIYDDERMRKLRIARMTSGHAQSVLSAARTARTLSRFVVLSDTADELEISSAQLLVGHKREETFLLGADVTHRIRFGETGPRIALKVVRLLNSDESIRATGFLL